MKLLKKLKEFSCLPGNIRTLRSVIPSFSKDYPSNQNILDIFKGMWVSSFPKSSGLIAGNIPHFDDDTRMDWVEEVLEGGFHEKEVLELGPFEGYHTEKILNFFPKHLVSIESSNINYLKCLIVKEVLKQNAEILFGDFIKYLENPENNFDIIIASGVLYHLIDPLYFLRLASQRSRKIYLWTHIYNENNLQGKSFFNTRRNKVEFFGSKKITLHYRAYKSINLFQKNISYGNDKYSFWLTKADLLYFLNYLGLKKITIHIEGESQFGQWISLLAEMY